jgi:hypothetical protein
MRIPNKRVGNIGPIHYSKLLLLFLPLSIALVLACAGEPAAPPATAINVPTSTFPAPISTPQLPAISNQGIPSPEQQLGTHPSLATASPEPTREKLAMQKSGEEMPHPLYKLIKPHFFANSANGVSREVQGRPDLILERNGKVKIRLQQEGQTQYLDLLALKSELMGEHPVEKILRLREMGIPIEEGLAGKLQDRKLINELLHTITFEYLTGKESSGVVAEVFPDGTFLVISFETPPEWQSDNPAIASPTHLHVNPRALSVRGSRLAQEYEEEILALPFEEQRYPAAPLARKQCDVYRESLQNEEYQRLLTSIGYKFTSAHVIQNEESGPLPFGEKLVDILREGAGEGVKYFGFESSWVADRLADLQVPWIEECDTAGSVRRYRLNGESQDRFYLIMRRSLEPDKKQRYKILTLDDEGSGQEVYTAPGIILMAQPLTSDENRWLISAEGWKQADDTGPADPRWQSVYLVNLKNPREFQKVQYPISQYPKAPDAGLYGASPWLSFDQKYLFNTLYGFTDEGGGIWVADLSESDFYSKPHQFTRIVGWDHTLSWTILGDDPDQPSPFLDLFMTGKEVADNFAMAANILRVKNAGLDSTVEYQKRLLQMVGWNPVPFAIQELSEQKFRVAVETFFNYESSLLPRAKGVYIVPVDLSVIDSESKPDKDQ